MESSGATNEGLGLGFAFMAGTTGAANLTLKHGTTDVPNPKERDLTGDVLLMARCNSKRLSCEYEFVPKAGPTDLPID